MAKLTDSVNFRLTSEEKQVWLQYCQMTARTQNDVFRDYLRTLAKKMSKKGASNPLI
ncbi:MAG: hypothetical protein F6K41_21475 [Symploca sp. SIO3E6]|nr:hypothetical protein [Caldora sp. SIO3E6]